MHRRLIGAVAIALALIAPVHAQPKFEPTPAQRKRVSELIDQLAKSGEPDYGYSPTANGISFLPVDAEGQFISGILFQPPPVPSSAMRELVKLGAAAVPQLLEHLTDGRRTKIVVTNSFDGLFGIYEDPAPKDAPEQPNNSNPF